MKVLKIVIVNLLLVFIIVFAFELHAKNPQHFWEISEIIKRMQIPKPIAFTNFTAGYYHTPGEDYRDVLPENPSGDIILFGCSYVDGAYIWKDHKPSGVLSKYTNKNVYTFGVPGEGVASMFKVLINPKLYEDYPQPEYVIFITMFNHLYRTYPDDLRMWAKYTNKDRFLSNFYTYVTRKISLTSTEQHNELYKAMLKESDKIIQEHWPGTKLVLLVYQDIETGEDLYNHPDRGAAEDMAKFLDHDNWKDIEDAGITVVYTKDLVGSIVGKEQWQFLDAQLQDFGVGHPSGHAWQQVIPALAKKLNI